MAEKSMWIFFKPPNLNVISAIIIRDCIVQLQEMILGWGEMVNIYFILMFQMWNFIRNYYHVVACNCGFPNINHKFYCEWTAHILMVIKYCGQDPTGSIFCLYQALTRLLFIKGKSIFSIFSSLPIYWLNVCLITCILSAVKSAEHGRIVVM